MGAYPEESGAVLGHEGVGFRFVFIVQSVKVKVLLVAQEALAHQEGHVVTVLQFAQEIVVVDMKEIQEEQLSS